MMSVHSDGTERPHEKRVMVMSKLLSPLTRDGCITCLDDDIQVVASFTVPERHIWHRRDVKMLIRARQ
jgi:hypothetical protein